MSLDDSEIRQKICIKIFKKCLANNDDNGHPQ